MKEKLLLKMIKTKTIMTKNKNRNYKETKNEDDDYSVNQYNASGIRVFVL